MKNKSEISFETFPSFATAVKKGFFWHYLDTSKKRYPVEEEKDIPCRPMNISQSGSQSFRMLYYKKRISAEFFHILKDGSGGILFLKALLMEYLRLLGKTGGCESSDIPNINTMPPASELSCNLPESEEDGKWSGFMDKPALQLREKLSRLRICKILHFKLDAEALKEAARQKKCTVTAYILSQLFVAGRYSTDEYSGEMNIQVPVNLRQYYLSDTMRNFFMCCGIRIPLERIDVEEGLVDEVSNQLLEKASRKAMSEMMNTTSKLVKAVAYIPLSIKAPVARIAYGFLGDRVFSNTFSNLGVINMPPEMMEHIEGMNFILGIAITNRVCCTLITFGDTATLTVSKLTEDPSFEEKLGRAAGRAGTFKGYRGE